MNSYEIYLDNLIKKHPELDNIKYDIKESFIIIKKCFENNKTLFICGNGGSASDSEHIVGELMKGFKCKREPGQDFLNKVECFFGKSGVDVFNKLQKGMKAIALTSHPSLNTAFANDVDSELIFAQQLYVLSSPGDVLLGITTSGNSKNVLRALQLSKINNLTSIVLTGKDGGKCSLIADKVIKVPENETYLIQELHLPIYHTICLMLEEYFYGSN